MTDPDRIDPLDPKATLHRYLNLASDALLWKLDGLSEYDVRRPLTPTGTNLLGLVKHLASVELGYFTSVFGRPCDIELPWFDEGAESNADMWATPDESREQIIELFAQARRHADATIEALPLDAPGHVPWWGERGDVTLHLILVHMVTEINRHLGHADIVRELIDGGVGHRADVDNLPEESADWWSAYRDRVEQAALSASGKAHEYRSE